MMVLKSCKQDSCRDPWKALHPDGSVRHLQDALSPQFDAFYDEQPRVQFTGCELGYLLDVEGPQDVNQDTGKGLLVQEQLGELKRRKAEWFRYGGQLEWWT